MLTKFVLKFELKMVSDPQWENNTPLPVDRFKLI